MLKSASFPLVLCVSLIGAGVFACGDDSGSEAEAGDGDGDGDTGGEVPGDGDGDDPGDGDGDGDGDNPGDGDGDDPGDGDGDNAGDGDGEAPGDGDGEAPGDGDGEPPGDCLAWEITYALTGSEFEIADTPFGAGDQVNVVQEPYDDDENVGPGMFVLQFQDVDGEPGGQVFMHAYDMTLNFVVSSGATVTTDLETEAGPEACGITSGSLDGSTVAWSPAAIVDLQTMGTILCEGFLCQAGGLLNGMPVPVDTTEDQPLANFDFSDGVASFTMAQTVIAQDDNSTTSWMYQGTELSRELVAAPACLCE